MSFGLGCNLNRYDKGAKYDEGANKDMAEARNAENSNADHRHTFGSIVSELKHELVDFARTRAQLLFSEVRDKTREAKKSAVFGAIALIFASVTFLLFTLAAVALVAIAFRGSPFAFFLGFAIIGIYFLLLGSITAIVAFYGLKSLAPQKTIRVLHDDKTWVRAELGRPTSAAASSARPSASS